MPPSPVAAKASDSSVFARLPGRRVGAWMASTRVGEVSCSQVCQPQLWCGSWGWSPRSLLRGAAESKWSSRAPAWTMRSYSVRAPGAYSRTLSASRSSGRSARAAPSRTKCVGRLFGIVLVRCLVR